MSSIIRPGKLRSRPGRRPEDTAPPRRAPEYRGCHHRRTPRASTCAAGPGIGLVQTRVGQTGSPTVRHAHGARPDASSTSIRSAGTLHRLAGDDRRHRALGSPPPGGPRDLRDPEDAHHRADETMGLRALSRCRPPRVARGRRAPAPPGSRPEGDHGAYLTLWRRPTKYSWKPTSTGAWLAPPTGGPIGRAGNPDRPPKFLSPAPSSTATKCPPGGRSSAGGGNATRTAWQSPR